MSINNVMRYLDKRFYLLLPVMVMILLSSGFYGYKKVIQTDYSIKSALLPQDELWTVEHSWQMVEAITPEIPQIDNEEKLLELIRHAWLWDKNAMIQYARIQKLLFGDPILDDFISRQAHRLTGRDGQRLRRPDIFDMDYSEFINRLADMQYPLAARLRASGLLWSAGESGLIHNSLTPESRAQLIHYTRYAIQGGYRIHSFLADYILFDTGFAYKDSNSKQLNTLPDRIRDLSQKELKESVAAYKVSALHGSQYAQIRMSEFYLYGVGVQQDLEMASAWSQIARESFENRGRYSSLTYRRKENVLNTYNSTVLFPLMRQHMTQKQSEKSVQRASQIKRDITETDYYTWAAGMDAIPPKP
ncbi:hypothetical protein ACVQTW_000629 [Klebsiella aerogenes]